MTSFGRRYLLSVGRPGEPGRQWTGLRMAFDIERKSRNSATAKIRLWNPDGPGRSLLEQGGNFVTLLAGYEPAPSLVFAGDVSRRGVVVSREETDRIVTIEAGDGELAWRDARFDWAFDAGTPNSTILTQLLATMGLGLAPGDPIPPIVYGSGVTFFGPARDALTQLASDAGMEATIQDGLLQLLFPGSVSPDGAALLSPQTGLIGSPEPTKNGINATSLLNPSLRLGRLIRVEAESFSGFYKAKNITHVGDTHETNWYTRIEAVPVEGSA